MANGGELGSILWLSLGFFLVMGGYNPLQSFASSK
jgi:hypothetical protein